MIKNLATGHLLAYRTEVCDTFWKRGRGLMFRRNLAEDEALVFVHRKESISDTSIHMLFVFFDIGVIWLDGEKRVVDKRLARPFRPYYAPRQPAQFFIECHPHALEFVDVGDELAWEAS
jgi:uncharacterized membrane protein (UPF0127 family)